MKNLIVLALSLASAQLAFGSCGACPSGAKAESAKAEKSDCSTACCELLSGYEKVSAALAADDLAGAHAAAEALACYVSCSEEKALGDALAQVAAAKSLEAARAGFKAVSAAVIPLAKDSGDHYIMTCPMAGADWLQTSKDVANPYMGKAMLQCGGIKQTVTRS